MGRLLIVTGILLILTAVGFMLATLGVLGKDIASQIIIPVACEPGDTIRTQNRISFSSNGSGQTTDYFCVDNEGDEEDVTGTVVMITIIGFVGLLLTGMMMIFGGSGLLIKRTAQKFTGNLFGQDGIGTIQTSSSTFDLRQNSNDFLNDQNMVDSLSQIPAAQQAQIQAVFSQLGDAFGNNKSLTDRLRQLEEARREGLISQTEYDRTRQAILDSMDD